MGFDIYWSLHRAHTLDLDERARAAAHVARWGAMIDGYDLGVPTMSSLTEGDLIAWGTLRPSHGDPRRSDHGGYLLAVIDQVLDALSELRTLFDGVELAVADDFGRYAWADGAWQAGARGARHVVSPEHRDGWVAASTLSPAPQALPAAAAPLLLVDASPQQVGEALSGCECVSRPAAVAGWADALGARLALDDWSLRPWTSDVVRAIAAIGGRSAWRAVALAADAGLPDAAGALARLAGHGACATLIAARHPAWVRFADLMGFLAGTTINAIDDSDVDADAAVRALNEAGSELCGVARWDDDDARSSSIPPSARARIAAFAEAAAVLGLRVDDETRALLAPTGDESIDELDDAFVAVTVALAERLAPALVGSLFEADRDAWRADAVIAARAPREPLVEAAPSPAPPSPLSAIAPPAPTGLAAGLARLDVAARAAVTPPAPPRDQVVIEGLLAALAKLDDPPSTQHLAELGLPASYARASRSDRAAQLERRLAQFDEAVVVTKVLERAEQLLDVYELGQILTPRLAWVADDPALMDRMLETWHRSLAERWRGCSGWARLIAPLASVQPVFAVALDLVAGPDRDRAWEAVGAAFDLLRFATGRMDEATSALVARLHADRGNPRETWRHLAYSALHELRSPATIPTAILELTATERVREAARLLPLIGRDACRGPSVLERALDLPDLAIEATRAICRSAAAEVLAPPLLRHAFWTIRLEAARKVGDERLRRAHVIAVWKTIDDARIPMASDERSRDRESGPIGPPVTLPPLPDPVEGLGSTCADYRHAALRVVDERRDPADAAALVWADELDRALQRRGHRRSAPQWLAWMAVVPEVARGRPARITWARAATSALPVLLERVRDQGADLVASTWPAPHLELTDDECAALRAAEQPLVERGAVLLWGD